MIYYEIVRCHERTVSKTAPFAALLDHLHCCKVYSMLDSDHFALCLTVKVQLKPSHSKAGQQKSAVIASSWLHHIASLILIQQLFSMSLMR